MAYDDSPVMNVPTDPFPRTVDELVKEYAQLNDTISQATKRRESLDTQFQKIMEQQQRAYQTVASSHYGEEVPYENHRVINTGYEGRG